MHVSLITLGVEDLARSRRFYEALGLRRAGFESEGVAFYDLGGTALALYPRTSLSRDTGRALGRAGASPVTLAWNVAGKAAVDAGFARLLEAGAEALKPPADVFWGGYVAYVADPDGHIWEIAYNPAWPVRETGALELPPPVPHQRG